MKNARNAPQVGLRIPQELKDWLTERAAANHRSVNGEVISILEKAMQQQKDEAPNKGR